MDGNKNGFQTKSTIEVNKDFRDEKITQEKYLSTSSSAESLIANPEEHGVNVIETLKKCSSNLDVVRPKNKTFSNDKVREIERKNSILMNKILAHDQRTNRFGVAPPNKTLSSSALNRKKKDREIIQNNLILLHKIQTAKPFGLSLSKR